MPFLHMKIVVRSVRILNSPAMCISGRDFDANNDANEHNQALTSIIHILFYINFLFSLHVYTIDDIHIYGLSFALKTQYC